MSTQLRTAEQVIAELAEGAWGVVTRAELRAAGLSGAQITHRLARGDLIPVFPGVYRVGHRAPCLEAHYLAAVKACGEGAALSGLAAAHLWGITKQQPRVPEVTAPTERRIEGIRTHRARGGLDPREVASFEGIPLTTVARTLVDVAASLEPAVLAVACHEAGGRHGTTPREIEAVLARRPNARGANRLRRVLHGETKVALSRLEALFLELVRKAGLQPPEMNRLAGGRRVDCRWPQYGLTVELDSYRFHNSRHAWEQDRKREREAYARGDNFRRFTWEDLVERPQMIIAELRALLAAGTDPRRGRPVRG